MYNERTFDPNFLSEIGPDKNINIPVSFIQDLTQAASLQDVLNVMANWIFYLFSAERASITIKENDTSLKLYSVMGSNAIPMESLVPIKGTMVGRVFSTSMLTICDDLSQSSDLDCNILSRYGMGCCMDAPMIQGLGCIGTLNVAHREKAYYTSEHAIILQCLANWLALNIKLHLQFTEMELQASTDYLTETANRRAFMSEGERRLMISKSTNIPLAIGILDLDHFKSLNDKYGHDAGDYALKEVANVVKKNMRAEDIFARIGGEEFAMIITGHPPDNHADLFDNIRAVIEAQVIYYDGAPIKLTASIGFSSLLRQDTELSSILKRADDALYAAKRNGRNRVEFNDG
ncbi:MULTISPECIES: diguanylate cyclase [unclassified Aeromonas]|uniref:sensor domain-containing diguanylate cyclase n=1 Tax=unclassified Aeromonas TaxID=257493 RepID=UPI003528AEA6